MANKQAADIKYYSEGYGKAYIQLSDEHTLWKVHTLDKQISDKEAEQWDAFYYDLVREACKKFEEKSGVEVLLLGRSGRHVCVADTPQNRRRYRSLCNLQMKLENKVLAEFNKYIDDTNKETHNKGENT